MLLTVYMTVCGKSEIFNYENQLLSVDDRVGSAVRDERDAGGVNSPDKLRAAIARKPASRAKRRSRPLTPARTMAGDPHQGAVPKGRRRALGLAKPRGFVRQHKRPAAAGGDAQAGYRLGLTIRKIAIKQVITYQLAIR